MCGIQITYVMYRWRFFRRPVIADTDNVVVFSKAAIALHNYLRTEETSVYCPAGFADTEDEGGNIVEGSWRQDGAVSGLGQLGAVASNRYVCVPFSSSICIVYICASCLHSVIFSIHRYTPIAADVRERFKEYFTSSIGQVSWQYRCSPHILIPILCYYCITLFH